MSDYASVLPKNFSAIGARENDIHGALTGIVVKWIEDEKPERLTSTVLMRLVSRLWSWAIEHDNEIWSLRWSEERDARHLAAERLARLVLEERGQRGMTVNIKHALERDRQIEVEARRVLGEKP